MESEVYDSWNERKKIVESRKRRKFINKREVIYVSIGKNIGYEQDGKNELFERPVLVLKKIGINMFVGIPLTSKRKTGKGFFTFTVNNKSSTALLSQIRTFDTKRIERGLGYISLSDFNKLKLKINDFLLF